MEGLEWLGSCPEPTDPAGVVIAMVSAVKMMQAEPKGPNRAVLVGGCQPVTVTRDGRASELGDGVAPIYRQAANNLPSFNRRIHRRGPERGRIHRGQCRFWMTDTTRQSYGGVVPIAFQPIPVYIPPCESALGSTRAREVESEQGKQGSTIAKRPAFEIDEPSGCDGPSGHRKPSGSIESYEH
jgi:hypothetical protein